MSGPVEIGQSGYLLVFTSNKSSGSVYWDNVDLTFYRGQLLEENHYYPFGLTLTTLSTNPAEKNSIKFQTQRLEEDFGLNLYDFRYRSHDMQIGRFWQVDPLAAKYAHNSAYAFSENKVTAHRELESLESETCFQYYWYDTDHKLQYNEMWTTGNYGYGPTGFLNITVGADGHLTQYYTPDIFVTAHPDPYAGMDFVQRSFTWAYTPFGNYLDGFNERHAQTNAEWNASNMAWEGEAGWQRYGKPGVELTANAVSLAIGVGELRVGIQGLKWGWSIGKTLITATDVVLTTDDITGNADKMAGGEGLTIFERNLNENGRRGLWILKGGVSIYNGGQGIFNARKILLSGQDVDELGSSIWSGSKGPYDTWENYGKLRDTSKAPKQ